MIKLIVAAAITPLLLAACSSSGSDTKTPSLDPSAARQVYLETVRPLFPASNSDTDLINLAKAFCAALSSGISYASLVANETGPGVLSPDTVGKAIASAVVTYCPQNLSLLPGGADGP